MQKNTIIGIVAAVIVIGGVSYLMTRSSDTGSQIPSTSVQQSSSSVQSPVTTSSTSTTKSTSTKIVPKPVTSVKSSVVSVALGSTITASGLITTPKSTFTPSTQNIYAVLSLKNVTQRTQISYIRYYNGKYVDSKVSHPSKDGVKNFHFQWELTPGKTRKLGTYTLAFYVNGSKMKTLSYTVK